MDATSDQRSAPPLPPTEVRFAVVFNGGVSLAVWMGGVAAEIDALTREHGAYGVLMSRLGLTARADVITGTSAGGINGAALALAQVQKDADLTALRDLWTEHGRFDRLLRRPFEGDPTSLLQGDDYFLPRLEEAMEGLVATATSESVRSADVRPVDLTITTTLLSGTRRTTSDSLGQALHQDVHEGRFSFRGDPPGAGDHRHDFDAADLKTTARRLALAARCSASFPFAFEPAFVDLPADGGMTGTDLREHADWYVPGQDSSRYVVDGGVLVNTPTRAALEGIDRMPASGAVRRVMLMVVPHAPEPEGLQVADDVSEPPTVVETGAALFSSLTSRSGQSFVHEVEEHNKRVARRTSGRDRVLLDLAPDGSNEAAERLENAASAMFPYYLDDRTLRFVELVVDAIPKDHGGSVAQIRRAVEEAIGFRKPQAASSSVFLPVTFVESTVPPGNGWNWGAITVVRLGESVLSLVRAVTDHRAYGGANRSPETLGRLGEIRGTVHAQLAEARRLHADLLAVLTRPPEDDAPDIDAVVHWESRLEDYRRRLTEDTRAEDGTVVPAANPSLRGIADTLAEAARTAGRLIRDSAPPELLVWRSLLRRVSEDDEDPTVEQVINRLLWFEVVSGLVNGSGSTGTTPVDLVQISLNTPHRFTRSTRTADDKSGGMALARFSGFLKGSWRVNDWTWGRLDAATMLCRALCRPAAVHLLIGASGPRDSRSLQVSSFLDDILSPLLPGVVDLPAGLRAEAHAELLTLMERGPERTASLPRLADVFAYARQMEVIVDEVPALAAAIRADNAGGANARSRGTVFLAENKPLLEALSATPPAERGRHAPELLRAFDKAGIGREPLLEEAASDHMIRTAATTVAVAATVLDSGRSGLGFAKPFTLSVRGAAKVPYWLVLGLTAASTLARLVAILLLAVGGAVVVVEAFTAALPQWLTTFGAAALLTGIGYCALRGRSLLHGVALTAPVVPLLIWGVRSRADATTSAQQDLGLVASIVLLAVVLALMGSIREPIRAPGSFQRHHRARLVRAVGPFLRAYRPLVVAAAVLVGLVLAAGVAALLLPSAAAAVEASVDVLSDWWLAALAGLALATAVAVLPILRRLATSLSRQDDRERHPSVGRAQWAWTYGVGYVVLGAVVAWSGDLTPGEGRQFFAASLFAWGVLLAGVISWVIPLLARGRLRRRAVATLVPRLQSMTAEAAPAGNQPPSERPDSESGARPEAQSGMPSDDSGPSVPAVTAPLTREQRIATELRRLGLDYPFLLEPGGDPLSDDLRLTRTGLRLSYEIRAVVEPSAAESSSGTDRTSDSQPADR